MFMTLVNVIAWVVLIGFGYWLVTLIPLDAQFHQIIRVLFIVLAVLAALSLFGVLNIGVPRLIR